MTVPKNSVEEGLEREHKSVISALCFKTQRLWCEKEVIANVKDIK